MQPNRYRPPVPAPHAVVHGSWARSAAEVLEQLGVSSALGLSLRQVQERQASVGPNQLRKTESRSAARIFADQFRSLLVALLAAATVVAFAFGEWIEGVAIAVVLAINATLGFFTELRARRSVEALRNMSIPNATVRRDGTVQRVPARELVPGDIVILEGGDIVTADLRLIQASRVHANESMLTGEAIPVAKHADALSSDASLPERANLLFKGTSVTRGSAEGVVVATGMDTELGHISRLVDQAHEERTPLERRLNRLGQGLVWITLAIATLVVVAGLWNQKPLFLVLETAIALAVASVPEGLPIIATIALARGMHRMARRNAVVNRLSAVETLGSTTILCADKTGTLTENRMTVQVVFTPDAEFHVRPGEGTAVPSSVREALKVGVLCNNATLDDGEGIGDPLEVALLRAGAQIGVHRHAVLDEAPQASESAFDPEVKMMATVHVAGDTEPGYFVAVKGAPEPLLAACSQVLEQGQEHAFEPKDRMRWIDKAEAMAKQGLRVIAVARRNAASANDASYHRLTFLGLLGLLDPPRGDVRSAIGACHSAGIRVVMVTGDHPATAHHISRSVGLTKGQLADVVLGSELDGALQCSAQERARLEAADVFARVSPRQKLTLITLHQQAGQIVAMTGDGVNDAPALKKADIGVAMGARGTDVAREAADLVLRDDALSTIAYAVAQGRVIFDNIRNFVLYLLSCNLSEILVIGFATAVGAPLPLLPLQILYLNLVTDVFPALALGVGEGDRTVMQRPPRDPQQAMLRRADWWRIVYFSGLITASTLSVFGLALGRYALGREQAVTIAFLTLAFAQLWHVFNMKRLTSPVLRNEITKNGYVWAAIAMCVALLVIAVYLPALASVLRLAPPSVTGWLLVGAGSLLPLIASQATLGVARWLRRPNADQSKRHGVCNDRGYEIRTSSSRGLDVHCTDHGNPG